MRTIVILLTFIIALSGTRLQAAEDIPLAALKKGVLSGFGQLPEQIDAGTWLDKVEVGHMEVVYHYRLTNFTYLQLNFAVFKQAIKPNITAMYCTDQNMKAQRDANIAMLYMYYDKNHELLGTIKTDSSVCSQ